MDEDELQLADDGDCAFETNEADDDDHGLQPGSGSASKERRSINLTLPYATIKRMVKAEGDVKQVAGDATFAIAKATELFLEELAHRAGGEVDSRKTLTYNDVAAAVKNWSSCEFLADIVPQKVPVSVLASQQPIFRDDA